MKIVTFGKEKAGNRRKADIEEIEVPKRNYFLFLQYLVTLLYIS